MSVSKKSNFKGLRKKASARRLKVFPNKPLCFIRCVVRKKVLPKKSKFTTRDKRALRNKKKRTFRWLVTVGCGVILGGLYFFEKYLKAKAS